MNYAAAVLCILIWWMLKKNIMVPQSLKAQDGVVEVNAEAAVQKDHSQAQQKV